MKIKHLFLIMLAVAANIGTVFASDTSVDGIWYNFNTTDSTAQVTYRGSSSGSYSNEYSGSVTIPPSVNYNGKTYSITSIGDAAFADCIGLASVTIGNSVTRIGNGAFSGCIGLTSVNIPNSVTSIWDGAFYKCTGLTSVTIPNSVTSIGEGAFTMVPNIVYEGTARFSPWGARSVNGYVDGWLVYRDATQKELLACSSIAEGKIIIPNSVTSIGDAAFADCIGLASVTIPNSVTSIGDEAFYFCDGLTSVTIGNSVTSIGDKAFYGCSGLTSVTIPNSVTSIGNRAFQGCTSLTSVTIPNSVTSIGEGAFISVSNIVYEGPASGSPWGARSVNGYVDGWLVYRDASKKELLACFSIAEGELIIPNSVTSIGSWAFDGCSGLISVTIPNSITSIGDGAFGGCSGLISVTIPNSVTSIGVGAFYGCTSLTSITIPNSVTSIGALAFYLCTGLTSVTIGNSVTRIGSDAFNGCKSLKSITIPNSVTSIGGGAFTFCTSMTSVTCFTKTPPELGSQVFYGVPCSNIPLYVLFGSVSAYKAADQWTNFRVTPISATGTETTDITTTTTENSVEVIWPQVNGAYTYELVIKDKAGNVICTLIFNAQGQLTSIAFHAPSQNNTPQQTQAAGFSFTVTGLESGTMYYATITAKDSGGNTLSTKTISFVTNGVEGIEEIMANPETNGRKVLIDGQVLIRNNDKLFNLNGQEVR